MCPRRTQTKWRRDSSSLSCPFCSLSVDLSPHTVPPPPLLRSMPTARCPPPRLSSARTPPDARGDSIQTQRLKQTTSHLWVLFAAPSPCCCLGSLSPSSLSPAPSAPLAPSYSLSSHASRCTAFTLFRPPPPSRLDLLSQLAPLSRFSPRLPCLSVLRWPSCLCYFYHTLPLFPSLLFFVLPLSLSPFLRPLCCLISVYLSSCRSVCLPACLAALFPSFLPAIHSPLRNLLRINCRRPVDAGPAGR